MEAINRAAALTMCVLVSGCAGRQAQPVPVTMSYDTALSCGQIQAEIQGNEQKALQLAGEASTTTATNVAVGVVGVLLFWPALFALNLSDAEQQEMSALRTRNGHLATLADVHGCNNPPSQSAQQGMTPPVSNQPAAQSQVVATPATTTVAPASAAATHWIGQGYRDACNKPYSIDVAVDAGWLKGHLRTDNADYAVNLKLNPEGNLDHSLVPLADPGNAPSAAKSIDLKIMFSDHDATGGYSKVDGNAFSCTTAVTLERV